jgi:hypothetical protein
MTSSTFERNVRQGAFRNIDKMIKYKVKKQMKGFGVDKREEPHPKPNAQIVFSNILVHDPEPLMQTLVLSFLDPFNHCCKYFR